MSQKIEVKSTSFITNTGIDLATSGEGGINYINGASVTALLTGVSTYDDTGAYVDGTGGSPSAITVSYNNTSPLDANGDIKLSKAAVSATGEGLTLLSKTIDSADKGRKLWVSFEWDGTHANYVANDMQIYAYDVTNNTILPVYAVNGATPNTSTQTPELPKLKTKVLGYITPPTTCSEVRISIHCLSDSASGSAYDVYVARPKLSPEATVPGAIVTPWKTAGTMTIGAVTTPPTKGTIVKDEISYRRVGNVGYFRYVYRQSVAGSAGSGDYLFSLPDNLQFDTNFITVYTGGSDVNDGSWRAYGTGGGTHDSGSHWQWAGIVPYSATQFRILVSNSSSSGPFIDNANYGLNLTNYGFYVEFEVPISGWSASAALTTTEVGLQSVQVSAYKNGGAVTADTTIASWTGETTDSHSAFNSTSGEFTAPKTGKYLVSFACTFTTSGVTRVPTILKNGTAVAKGTADYNVGGGGSITAIVSCTKGDIITVYSGTSAGTLVSENTGATLFISEQPDLTVFSAYSNERKNVVSKSSTYSVLPGDDVLILSGASFTATLYDAVGQKGREIKIIHGGTSLTQVYTLATTSSQTIGGVAGGSYKLCTNGETLTLVSDGSNWQILDHKANTGWVNAGTITIAGTTTNPTKGSTQATDKLWWRRDGDSAQVRFEFRQTSSSGSAAGSGDYLFSLPSGMAINTSKLTAYATVEGSGYYITDNVIGNGMCFNGTNDGEGFAVAYDTQYIRLFVGDGTASNRGAVGSGYFPITNATTGYFLTATIPITDWQP